MLLDPRILQRTAIETYSEEDRIRILTGLILTEPHVSVPYLEQLITFREFVAFLRDFHPKAFLVVKSLVSGADADILLSVLHSEMSVEFTGEEIDTDRAYFLKILSRLFVQYLSAQAAAENALILDEDRLFRLIKVATNFPHLEPEKTAPALPKFDRLIEFLRKSSPILYETKFPTLNELFGGGLRRKRLYTIGGIPGVGKSHLLLNFFVDAALKSVKSLYITLENSSEETQQRITSHLTQIPLNKLFLDSDDVAEKVRQRLSESSDQYKKLCRYGIIVEKTYCQIKDIERLVLKYQPRLVVIDYLNLMDHRVYGDRPKDLEDLTKKLHDLAQEKDIAILTVCQLNREAVRMDDPDQATVGESFGIIKASDVFFALYHPRKLIRAVDEDPPQIVLRVVKSRISKLSRIWLWADKSTSTYREMTLEEIEEVLSSSNSPH